MVKSTRHGGTARRDRRRRSCGRLLIHDGSRTSRSPWAPRSTNTDGGRPNAHSPRSGADAPRVHHRRSAIGRKRVAEQFTPGPTRADDHLHLVDRTRSTSTRRETAPTHRKVRHRPGRHHRRRDRAPHPASPAARRTRRPGNNDELVSSSMLWPTGSPTATAPPRSNRGDRALIASHTGTRRPSPADRELMSCVPHSAPIYWT